jgi:MYXO-CTERM domain-containing protein
VKVKVALLLLLLAMLTPAIHAQQQNRAGLIVRYEDGRVETMCVAFAEEQVTGYDLLNRAGLDVEAKMVGMGATVCRLNDQGCPQSDCFCHCPGGSDCLYWSYWLQEEDAWNYASIGPSVRQVSDGMVEGWSWGPGSLTDAIPPPDLTFADICTDETAVTPMAQVEIEPEPTNWLPYLLFGLLLAGLVGLAAVQRRRTAG